MTTTWQRSTLLFATLTALCALGGCGKAPIEDAVGKNDRKAVAEAIKAGADVNARTSSGDTPLFLAAKSAQSSSAIRAASAVPAG